MVDCCVVVHVQDKAGGVRRREQRLLYSISQANQIISDCDDDSMAVTVTASIAVINSSIGK